MTREKDGDDSLMLIGESKESNYDIHDGEGHEPDVGRMPDVVVAGRGRSHDVGQVVNDILLEFCGNLPVAFCVEPRLWWTPRCGRPDRA